MRENSSVVGHNLVNSGVRLTLILIFLLCALEFSLVDSKTEFSKKSTDVQPSSLCPASCTCSEQKLKLQGSVEQDISPNNQEEVVESINVKSKTKPEILKSGIRVQCQNPAFIVSVKKLNLQAILVENIVQYDLSGNSLTKLSSEDFASGNYLMLQKLMLKNNQIEDIAADTLETLKNLKYLDLSNNQLKNFSSAIIENLPNLERVKLNGNPLKCDCQLSALLTYVSSRNIRLQGTCMEPARLKDRSLTRLVLEELACPPEDQVSVEIRPNTNQIVFEGDPLKLSCKFKAGRAVAPSWIHRNANNQTATVSAGGAVELTTSSRGTDQGTVTESQLLIRQLLPRHGGAWACSWGGRTASVEVTVLSLTTPTCTNQITVSNKGRYSWPRTISNLKVVLPCQANPNLQAFRLCGALGSWEEPDLNSCFYLSEVTKVLEQFAKTNLTFSKTSALESARRLKSYLTDVVTLTDPHEAIFVTQTLHNYLEASGKHPELLPIIMDIYSIMITQDPQLLTDSRHGLVGVLQQAPLKTTEFEYRSSSLVIEKCAIVSKSLSAGTCTWQRTLESTSSKPDTLKTKAQRSRYQASCGQTNSTGGSIEASVRIPLISEGAFLEQNIILFLVLSTNAFVSAKMKPLATPVLGITSGPVTNLINRTTPFVMTMRLNRAIGPSDRLVGARWNQYTDQWSPEQCQTLKSSGLMSEGDSVTFQCCCGFGFFAAFTTHDDVDEHDLVEQPTTRSGTNVIPGAPLYPGQLLYLLPSPVYVGSVIGLLCHLTACICYLIHRQRLRMTQPTRHSLFNTWLSVGLLMVAFTLGVRPVLGKVPCQVAGLLLHYLTLSSLLWMVVNASSLYKHITKSSRNADPESNSSLMEEAMAVGHESPPKPALRFYLIGWGIPLIVVGIAGAIHLEQYYGPRICFLAWTPSLGAVGLPSAILILLILTFHLLTWCFLRHTSRLAAIHQKQLAAKAASEDPGDIAGASAIASESNKDMGTSGRKDKKTCGQGGGYVPLAVDGDVTSCPSNVTNQVTETSDLASLSSDQERIALLIQRGEAEGAMSANESGVLHSGRSESERPLLIVTSSAASSSDDRLEDGIKTDVDDQGHSNPLMASFTDDGDSKKRECASSVAPSMLDAAQNTVFHPNVQVIPPPVIEDADEKSPLSQLRGQFVFLLLFCLTWLSGLCVVTRPFRTVLPQYDELVYSLCYAIFSAATGLHSVLFHLLTRKDVCASCFEPKTKENVETIIAHPTSATNSHPDLPSHHNQQQHHSQPIQLPVLYSTLSRHPELSDEVDRGMERTTSHAIDPALADAMNVTIMDPSMVVNSFYDPRQSKTARRFFQKQKLLQQMQNNQLHRHHHSHHHHHHRHSRHSSGHSINNAHSYRSHSSHSPITEEALLNASTSTKTKVSNVNIHVEMGAYDWHELQSRLSDNSWSKSGKQMLPPTITENGNPRTLSRTEVAIQDAETSTREEGFESQLSTNGRSIARIDKGKRKRHVIYHPRIPKKSKLEDHLVAMVEVGTQVVNMEEETGKTEEAAARQIPSAEKPVYVFVDNEYRERALAHLCSNDESMKTLTSVKIKKVMDESMDEGAYQKRETSV